jgi:membrane protease YdiL (CAAX protease family)
LNPLHELIRRLPPRLEFLIVIMWAFGLPIFSSILSIGGSDAHSTREYFNDTTLMGVLIMEVVQTLFLVWFLRIRGWTLQKLGLEVTLRGTAVGIVLLAVTLALLRGILFLAQTVLPADMQLPESSSAPPEDVSMSLVYLVATFTGVFEEVFVAGYVISALTPVRGVWAGINVSTGLRLLYHLYQGPIAIICVVPVGLLFGYVYARTRLLWALIVANIGLALVSIATELSRHAT